MKKLTGLGTWIHSNSIVVVNKVLDYFNWIVLDMEHTSCSFSFIEEVCQIARAKEKKVLVRITSYQNFMDARRALDLGANGIIVPMIKTDMHAMECLKHIKYKYSRGVAFCAANNYGANFSSDWLKKQDEETIFMVMLEHIAIEIYTDLLVQTPEIDGMFIGRYDLRHSCNNDSNRSKWFEIDSMNIFKKANKMVGVHLVDTDNYKAEIEAAMILGYDTIAIGTDMTFLNSAMKEATKEIII